MKKHFASVLLFCFICSNCINSNAGDQSLNVTVDPRFELLSIVQLLSGYGKKFNLITSYDFPYKRDILEYFSPYKNHSAVKLFAEMSAAGFTYDAPPGAMLFLSAPPDLRLTMPFTDYLETRAGGSEKLERFVNTLRDFARETQFMTFFNAHKGTFLQIVANEKKKLEGTDYVGDLEKYYGQKQHSYNIILVPLFVGGFGPRIKQTDGTYDIYNITGPRSIKNALPGFGSAEALKHVLLHEFSHSFINPITESFKEQISKYSSLYDPVSSWMKDQAYGDWMTCVNEHIIRAVSARFASLEKGKEAGDQRILSEKRRGFFYVEPLYEQLENYEAKRNIFPTIKDFYPEFIKVFKELSEKELGEDFFTVLLTPFTGTINNVFVDDKSVILIVPTNESDKAIEKKIHAYVKTIHDSFFKDSPILTDKEALNRDFSSNALVIYGTPKGNLWLSQILTKLPVRIESDRIVAETVYQGDHLRFITAWPNPQNPKRGMVIYTAQKAEDIIGINSLFHGPTDYVVAKGMQSLKAANYKKQNGQWSFIK